MKTKLLLAVMFACICITSKSQTLTVSAADTCHLSTISVSITGDKPVRYGWLNGDSIIQINAYWNPVGKRIDKESGNYVPSGITIDKEGNIYVVEQNNNRVMKYAPGSSTGILAAGGNGFGDASNQLEAPVGIAVDSSNNLYIADALNSRVQKWAPGAEEGVTVAGGNGYGDDANQLKYPVSIIVSGDAIFVSDFEAASVKKFTNGSADGIIVAGGNGFGSADNQLSNPFGISLDSAGNLYIADSYNNRIQKWAPNAKAGVTVAGGKGKGLRYDQLSYPIDAVTDTNGDIFILDNGNNRVQCKKKREDLTVTIAGGIGETTDKLQRPQDIFLSADSKKLYVANWYTTTGGVIEYTKSNMLSNKLNPVTAGEYKAIAIYSKNNIVYSSNSVIMNSAPLPLGRIKGKKYHTLNEIVSYTDSASGFNNHYKWTVPADAVIISGQGKPHIKVQFGSSYSGYISVTASNSCGSAYELDKQVFLQEGLALKSSSINASAISLNAGIYPNPAKNKTTLSFTSKSNTAYTISITDVSGKKIYHFSGAASAGINSKTINIAGYSAGVYFITLLLTGEKHTYRLVIEK